jgi:hypothetical protein
MPTLDYIMTVIIPAYGGCSHSYAVIPIKITLSPNLCWLKPWFYHRYTHLNQAKCTGLECHFQNSQAAG